MSQVGLLATPAHSVPMPHSTAAILAPPREKLHSLQALRFLAAFLVFFSHIEDRYENWEGKYHMAVPRLGLDGQLGVDIFFVISGFVMGYVALDKFGRRGAPWQFAADRVAKIVPLYWVLTLVQCLVFLASSQLGGNLDMGRLNLGETLKSLFFIPYFNVEGKHRPLLGQGWTLNYEMAFYVVLTASLFLRKAWGIAAVTGTILLVWFLGNFLHVQNAPLQILSAPIIFEFLLGLYLAALRSAWLASGRNLPRIPGVTILIVAVIAAHMLFFGRHTPLWINAAIGLLTVSLCVFTQNAAPKDIVGRTMTRLGDSSYSLYLSHNLTLLVMGVAWRGVFGAAALWAYLPVVIAIGLAAGHVCYLLIEQPGTKLLRRSLQGTARRN
ncbi:MAG TPA: acyltransferase [Rhizomicrobium sp.]|nr:acyltransferase [Rhizomicrobium sp.]